MKKKQLIGLVVAGVVFAFVCSMSVLTNKASDSMLKKETLLKSLAQASDNFQLPTEDFIGVVDVEGTIMNTTTTSVFDTVSYNHERTLKLIDALKDSKYNQGILLTVNSPGGGIYESDDLYLKLKEYKEETGRPVWTYMESQACSGGYYIAMASDNIVANRNTWTGSIGVIIGLTNYKELADKIGFDTIYFTSGPNKAMGAATLDITDEQRGILQSLVDEAYIQFVDIVSEGRQLSADVVKPIADGRIYSAAQALELDLIDKVDTYENTVAAFQAETDDAILFEPAQDPWGFSSLFGAAMKLKPRSDAEIMTQFLEKQGSGVPMYYAYPGQ